MSTTSSIKESNINNELEPPPSTSDLSPSGPPPPPSTTDLSPSGPPPPPPPPSSTSEPPKNNSTNNSQPAEESTGSENTSSQEVQRRTKRQTLSLDEFFSASLYKIYVKMVITHMTMNEDGKEDAKTLLDSLKRIINGVQGERQFKLPYNLTEHPLYKKEYFEDLKTVIVGQPKEAEQNAQTNVAATGQDVQNREYRYTDKFFEEREQRLIVSLTEFAKEQKFTTDHHYVVGDTDPKKNELILELKGNNNEISRAIICLSFILNGKIEDYVYSLISEITDEDGKVIENLEMKEAIKEKLITDIDTENKEHIESIKDNKLFTRMFLDTLNKKDTAQPNESNNPDEPNDSYSEYKYIVKHMDLLRQIARLKVDEQIDINTFQKYMKYCVLEESLMQLLPYIRVYYSSINESGNVDYAPKLEKGDSSKIVEELTKFITDIKTDNFGIRKEKQEKRDEIKRKIEAFSVNLPESNIKDTLNVLIENLNNTWKEYNIIDGQQSHDDRKHRTMEDYRQKQQRERRAMEERYTEYRNHEGFDYDYKEPLPSRSNNNINNTTIEGLSVQATKNTPGDLVLNSTKKTTEKTTEVNNVLPPPPDSKKAENSPRQPVKVFSSKKNGPTFEHQPPPTGTKSENTSLSTTKKEDEKLSNEPSMGLQAQAPPDDDDEEL